MIRFDAMVGRFNRLNETLITDWIARGWIDAAGSGPADWRFPDGEVARVRLLYDLQVDLAIDEDSIPVVLSLIDQLYGVRRTLRVVMDIVETMPDTAKLRDRILAALAHPNADGPAAAADQPRRPGDATPP